MFEQTTITHSPGYVRSDKTDVIPKYRMCAYSLLRATLGIVFLVAGIGKFISGIGAFESGLEEKFAGKLPAVLIKVFGYSLPFVEVIIGALLLAGLFSLFALVLAGLELMALTFGVMVVGDTQSVAHNTQYALVNFILLWFVRYNGYSLDGLLRSRRERNEVTEY